MAPFSWFSADGQSVRASVFMKSWITSRIWMGSSCCPVQSCARCAVAALSLENGAIIATVFHSPSSRYWPKMPYAYGTLAAPCAS